jgi:hypothetical protein
MYLLAILAHAACRVRQRVASGPSEIYFLGIVELQFRFSKSGRRRPLYRACRHPPCLPRLKPRLRVAQSSLLSAPNHARQDILLNLDAVAAAERTHRYRSALEDHGLNPTRGYPRPRARMFATPACRMVACGETRCRTRRLVLSYGR